MVAVLAPGCATRPGERAAPGGVVGAPAKVSAGWVRTELYFSLGEWMETALSTEAESRWAEFLDREVTPRFPDGLSVIDVYGQWRSAKPGAPILRERSRLLVIVHPASPDVVEKIEAVRRAWKQANGEESVLRVSVPAEVSF